MLRRVTEMMSREVALEGALQEVVEASLELVPGDHASLRVLDATRTKLLAAARSGAGTEGESFPLSVGEGIAGWVIEKASPALVPDVRADARFVPAATPSFPIASMLAEPLLSGGVAIGVLSVSSATTNAFSRGDALLARILANCSVPLLERARLVRLAVTDPLTTAFNLNYLRPRLAEEMERARDSGAPLSVLAFDLDHLDRVNHAFGRDLGDRLVMLLAEKVRSVLRRYDVLVRCDEDDEFLVLLPATNPTQAYVTAERIRALGEQAIELRPGGRLTQNLSIGLATWHGEESADALLERVARGLLEAKQAGGNRVVRALARVPGGERS